MDGGDPIWRSIKISNGDLDESSRDQSPEFNVLTTKLIFERYKQAEQCLFEMLKDKGAVFGNAIETQLVKAN